MSEVDVTDSTHDAAHIGKRESRKRATRHALHESAMRLSTAHGFEATTVAAIARDAGVAPRTFFGHYASKEAALYGPLDDVVAALESRLAMADRVDTLEVLREWIEHDVIGNSELAPILGPELEGLASESDSVATHGLRYADRIAQALAESFRHELPIAPDDPIPDAAAAAAIAALTSGLPLGHRSPAAGVEAAHVLAHVDRTLRFVRAGLAATVDG